MAIINLAKFRAALAAVPEIGADLLETFEDHTGTLRNEAMTHRQVKAKVLAGLGIKDGEDVDQVVGQIQSVIAGLKQAGNNDPTQILASISDLSKQVKALTESAAAEKTAKEQEKTKRIQAAINAAAIEALTAGKASNATEIAKLIAPNLVVGEDDKVSYKQGDKTVAVAEGVAEWLKVNPWAVTNTTKPGSGSNGNNAQTGAPKYTKAQIEGMSQAEINANWADVSASMAANNNGTGS